MAKIENPKVYSAIMAVSEKLNVPKDKASIQKGTEKYKYRTLSALREAIKPLLAENNLFLGFKTRMQFAPSTKLIKDYNNGVQRYEIMQQMLTMEAEVICTEDGSKYTTEITINHDDHNGLGMSGEQASGSAHTYAEKLLLCQLFHVEDEGTSDNDPDALQGKEEIKVAPQTQAKPQPKIMSWAEVVKMMDNYLKEGKIQNAKDGVEYIKKHYPQHTKEIADYEAEIIGF